MLMCWTIQRISIFIRKNKGKISWTVRVFQENRMFLLAFFTEKMRATLFQNNPVVQLSFQFALDIVAYCESLQDHKRFVVSNQLLKAGTSIGANVMEAQNPESRSDFIHKMKIAAKEADETQYWLLICEHSKAYPNCAVLLTKLAEIQRVINTIINSAKKG